MKLGKRVLGEEEFERQQQIHAIKKAAAFKYGPRVMGNPDEEEVVEIPVAPPPKAPEPTVDTPPPTEEAPPEEDAPPAAPTLSITEMESALAGEPAMTLVDELIDKEFTRPEGFPRKGALKVLIAAEQRRGEGKRDAIITELSKTLEGL